MANPKRASALRVAIVLSVATVVVAGAAVWNGALPAEELEISWTGEPGIADTLGRPTLAAGRSCNATKGSSTTTASMETTRMVQEGVWGGAHVMMEISASGATITYDCAHGTIEQPIELDSSGSFDVLGTHTREHGGPVRSDETPDRHPARYTGHVDGKILTLVVALTDTKESVGTFSLIFGERPELHRCV